MEQIGHSWKTDKCNSLAVGIYNRTTTWADGTIETKDAYFDYHYNEGDNIQFQTVFEAKGISGQSYTQKDMLKQIIMGDEARMFLFENEYEKLNDTEKFVIDVAIYELKENPRLKLKNQPQKLARMALKRLKSAGLLVPCTRCGGSGNYSYNLRDGTRCYGCDGQKVTLPKRITQKWKKQVEEFDFTKLMEESK